MYVRNRYLEKRNNDISRCPVCGKRPKIHTSFNTYGNYVRIQCKPLFREPHYCVFSGKALASAAVETAIEYWNDEVSVVSKGES